MSSAACVSTGPRRAWDDEPAGVSDGVAVRPSCRTEGCSHEACCSCPAGPVAALVAGDGERRGDEGGEGGPSLSTGSASVSHGSGGAVASQSAKGKLRRTPTWRAKCRIQGSADP